MKYYNLPSAEQIACYHNGTLSVQDKQWIESVMQKNPFVKEAVKTFPTSQVQTVQQISERVGTRIKNQYLEPRGFWSKYGVWIGLSSVAILLTIGYFATNNAEQRYFLDGGQKQFTLLTVDEQENTSLEHENILSSEEIVEKSIEEIQVDPISSEKSTDLVNESLAQTNLENTEESSDASDGKNEEQVELNLSGKLLKNIRGIAIINVDKGGLKRREVPEFPGGDIGLTNHFQSHITPVELQYGEPLYDHKAQIVLMIGANGKLKEHEVQGNLHSLHQTQIETAVSKLPQFKPGKGDVSYTVEVKFN
jgi:hypothetical protein